MNAGRRAHGARLQGDHQHTTAKPVIAKRLTSPAQSQYFGMGRGIIQGHRGIGRLGQHPAVRRNQHCPHRNLAQRGGTARLVKGAAHELVPGVTGRGSRHGPGRCKSAKSPIPGARPTGKGERNVRHITPHTASRSNASDDCLMAGKATLQSFGDNDLKTDPCRAFQV